MTLRLLHCDAVAPQPWKNGGGSTRELLVWPPDALHAAHAAGATHEGWTLRISVADISADGPFSAYPGIDRHFAVLQGGGVRLDLPGGARELHAGDAPLAFDGEAAPGCTLLHGATRDLNLMTRRGAGQAAMRRAHAGQSFAPRAASGASGAPWALHALFAVQTLRLRRGGDVFDLPAFTLAWSDDTAPEPWHIDGVGSPQAYWIHFEAAPA